jgi:hypothetical protein
LSVSETDHEPDEEKDENGRDLIEIGVDLLRGHLAFLTITSGRGEQLYTLMEGRRELPGCSSLSESQVFQPKRRIGNSLDGGCSWSGDIFGLSFYDRVLSDDEAASNHQWWVREGSSNGLVLNGLVGAYTFREGTGSEARAIGGSAPPLSIPTRLHFQKSLLSLPEFGNESRRSMIKDGAVNIVGFVPLGFLLSLWLVRVKRWTPGRAFLLTVCSGMMISLFIESVQVLLPHGPPSLICVTTRSALVWVIAAESWELKAQG